MKVIGVFTEYFSIKDLGERLGYPEVPALGLAYRTQLQAITVATQLLMDMPDERLVDRVQERHYARSPSRGRVVQRFRVRDGSRSITFEDGAVQLKWFFERRIVDCRAETIAITGPDGRVYDRQEWHEDVMEDWKLYMDESYPPKPVLGELNLYVQSERLNWAPET